MSKAKKKRNSQQWIAVVLYTLIGAVCGILTVRFFDRHKLTTAQEILIFALLIVSAYAAMLIQIIIHEGGHLIFGLLTGYQFSSFRILNWMWLKENETIHLKHMSLAGTGGQCLMVPPELKDGKMPFLLYNFGGSLMNVITGVIFLILALVFREMSVFSTFMLILAMVGFVFAFMNGVPLHLGPVDNDGCNAFSMMKSQEAVRAFWVQMKANDLTARGSRLRDMPEGGFTVPDEDGLQNSITATIAVLTANRLMDEHEFEKADALMAHLLSSENAIIDLYRSMMVCDRMYIALLTGQNPELIDTCLTKNQKKFMKAMHKYPSVLRTEYTLALLYEHDEVKAARIAAEFDKMCATYPYPSEIEGERELMALAA